MIFNNNKGFSTEFPFWFTRHNYLFLIENSMSSFNHRYRGIYTLVLWFIYISRCIHLFKGTFFWFISESKGMIRYIWLFYSDLKISRWHGRLSVGEKVSYSGEVFLQWLCWDNCVAIQKYFCVQHWLHHA